MVFQRGGSDSKSVACMKTNGTLIYQYKGAGLRRPMGLICDDMGNIMVCDNSSVNIHVIGSDGKNFETLSIKSHHRLKEVMAAL